jgi:hypothetical protein
MANNTLQIFLRKRGDPQRHVLQLPVEPDDTVQSVSEKISKKSGLSTESMRVIFCGKRLEDHLSIRELNLGPQT